MKKSSILLLFIFAVFGAVAQDMTVASYNVRYRNDDDAAAGNGWERRCPWLCALIEFERFDIFGAQEVLDPQLRDMLAALPEYKYIGVGRDDGATQGEYAPIFYRPDRFRLLEEGHFWLSETPDRPSVGWDAALPRICTWGHFADSRTGRAFWFFNLHMDHIGVEARAKSAELVMRRICEMCDADERVILTGDFNVDQNDEIYRIFTRSDALADSFEAAERRYAPSGTFNAFDPELRTFSRIDHVFVSPAFRVMNYGVLTETFRSEVEQSTEQIKSAQFPKEVSLHRYEVRLPSDHFPVVVRLCFEKL